MKLQGIQTFNKGQTVSSFKTKTQRNTFKAQVSRKEEQKANKIDVQKITSLVAPGVVLTATNSAQAFTIDDGVNTVVGAVETTGDLAKVGLGYLDVGVDVAKQGYAYVEPYLKLGVDTAAPYVVKGAQLTSDLVGNYVVPNVKKLVPVVEDGVKQFAEAQGLNTSGVLQNVSQVQNKVGEASYSAQPFIQKFLNFVSTSQPVILAEYAAGIVAVYYLFPPLAKGLLSTVRGYAGSVAPAAVLNLIQNNGNAYIIDIRQPSEKERSGVPDLPGGYQYKLLDVEFAAIDNRRVRGQLKNPDKIETEVTALQIASLKKIGKGTSVYILDRYGNKAADVAKALTNRGFGRAYIVSGGFDGRNGWAQAKLAINKRQVYTPEILPQVFGTGSSRKYLPGN